MLDRISLIDIITSLFRCGSEGIKSLRSSSADLRAANRRLDGRAD
jgi:hypothetical protein